MDIYETSSPTRPNWVLLTFVGIWLGVLAAAVAVHCFSSLPWRYSWVRTLELFFNALTDKYFFVMAFVALVAGIRQSRPSSFLPRHSHVVVSMTLVVLALGLLLLASSAYGVWDYAFLVPVGFLTYRILLRRDLAHSLAGLIGTLGILVIVSYAFTIFKSQLFVFGSPLDGWIVEVERWLFGGPIYREVADLAVRYSILVSVADWVYYLFFHHMALTALFLFAMGDAREQWRYILSLSTCYLLGGLSYYIFPALGPVFYDPDVFRYLSEYAPFTAAVQDMLWSATEGAKEGKLKSIDTFAFVACMPSLHMAHESIMLYFSRRSYLMLGLAAVFWVISGVAVLVLGWHYFFDVIAGVLLAVFVVYPIRRFTPVR
jgi:hypothetical protein